MRTFTWPGASTGPSVLGMGCASFGSRVSPRHASRLLGQALDAGITYFDTAPSYGLGSSEAILGRFLEGKRDRAWVATKVGLAVRPMGALKGTVLPLARIVKRWAPSIVRSNLGGAITGVSLDDAGALNASIERSLRELRTDHVDVFLLHAYEWRGLAREGTVAPLLEAILKAGKARFVGISGSAASVCAAVRDFGRFSVAQINYGDRASVTETLKPLNTVINVHSVFKEHGNHIVDALKLGAGVVLVGMTKRQQVLANVDSTNRVD